MRRNDTFDDWRARMALRGGPLSHAIARAGWLVFAILGALVMVGVAALYAANPGANAVSNGVGANFVGGLIVMMPIGAMLGGLIGLPAQFATRSWLAHADRGGAPDSPGRTGTDGAGREAGDGTAPAGPLVTHLRVVREVGGALPQDHRDPAGGRGQSLVREIGTSLDEQLNEALRLARFAESLDDGKEAPPTKTARKVAALLSKAEKSFAGTQVRAQLDMLQTQSQTLKPT